MAFRILPSDLTEIPMIQPALLAKGDTVGLVSTARKIAVSSLAPAISLLESWGLRVVLGNSIGKEANQFAGTDRERAEDLQHMLDNPDIRAIWCARGGYGTVRIIDQLDFKGFLRNPKWIIGYSDVTVLHSQLQILGIESLHATMPIDLEKTAASTLTSLQNSLFNGVFSYEVSSGQVFRSGKASGPLVGGNLSILYSLRGSPSAIATAGKILFIEDLDEYLYHVDRMLINLQRNGCFDQLQGLVIGGMTDLHDNEIPFGKDIYTMVMELVADYDFPVLFGFPAGHLVDNRALIFGREVNLRVGPKKSQLLG